MYFYIIYTLFLRKMKGGRGKEMDQSLRNARHMEQSGGCSEQACWGGGAVKVMVRQAWEEKGRGEDHVLRVGELQIKCLGPELSLAEMQSLIWAETEPQIHPS